MNDDYDRIERAIRFMQARFPERPSLAEVSKRAGLTEFHFQRLFRRWAGLSPKRFLQALTVEHAKRTLAESRSVLDAAYASGLSGPGRLHDLFVAIEAVTPGEYKDGGAGVTIRYGVHPSPFGACVVAATERGVCGLAFAPPSRARSAVADVARAWRRATLVEDPRRTAPLARAIFGGPGAARGPLTLHLRGTNLQVQVWRALLKIPAGSLSTYADLAARIGRPKAARAVASAVASNACSYVIPCHRVIRGSGALGGYRWGLARKAALLAFETAPRASEAAPASVTGSAGTRLGPLSPPRSASARARG